MEQGFFGMTDPGSLFSALGLLLLAAAFVALVWLMRRLGRPFDGAGAADRARRRAAIVLLVLVALLAGLPGALTSGVGLVYGIAGTGSFERQFGWAFVLLGGLGLLLAAPFGIGAWRAIRRGAWA